MEQYCANGSSGQPDIQRAFSKSPENGSGGGTQQRPHTDRQLRNLPSGGSTEQHKQARSAETVVVNSNSGGELPVLDRELLNTGIGGGNTSSGGFGNAENQITETNRIQSGDDVADMVDIQSVAFNPDPRVADYESPMEVLEIWLNS